MESRGPVPPGGWDQRVAPVGPAWHGQLASWGARAVAQIVDVFVVLVPAGALVTLLVAGIVSSDDAGVVAYFLGIFVILLVAAAAGLLYGALLMMREGPHNGQTWGKQLMGIRVVRNNGLPMTFGPAAFREAVLKILAVGLASSIVPLVPWFLDYFWPLWDDQNRALHDFGAETHVVRA